jgi:hypothetical protein
MKAACRLMLIAICASACTRAPAQHPARAPASPAASKVVWQEHEIPGTGLFARFPATPGESVDWTKTNPAFLYRAVAVENAGQVYSLFEIALGSRAGNDSILSAATQYVRNVKQRQDVRLGPFRGLEVLGEAEKGGPTLVRTFAIGGSIMTATAVATSGALDISAARQFVDSMRLDMPWRVEPIPALGVSVALPAKVFPLAGGHDFERFFVLGGVDAVSYYVSMSPIAQVLQSNPDEVLTAVVGEYGTRGTVTFASPVELDGARGREVIAKVGAEHIRIRVYAHEDRLYQIMVSSTAKEQLTTDDARRFFESLRWFD